MRQESESSAAASCNAVRRCWRWTCRTGALFCAVSTCSGAVCHYSNGNTDAPQDGTGDELSAYALAEERIPTRPATQTRCTDDLPCAPAIPLWWSGQLHRRHCAGDCVECSATSHRQLQSAAYYPTCSPEPARMQDEGLGHVRGLLRRSVRRQQHPLGSPICNPVA